MQLAKGLPIKLAVLWPADFFVRVYKKEEFMKSLHKSIAVQPEKRVHSNNILSIIPIGLTT